MDSRSKLLRSFTLILIGALVASLAHAAQHDSFDEKMSSVILLQSKVVQKELGVTTQQRAAMNKFADAHRLKLNAYYQQIQSGQGKSAQISISAKDEQQLQVMFNTMKRGVLAQLSAAQLKRLREISLQTLDFTALGDQSVDSRIGLSGAQRTKVQAAITAGLKQANGVRNNAIANATKGVTSQDEANRRAEAASDQTSPQVIQIRNGTKAKVMSLLTAQQRAKWQALLGKPFKG